MHAFPRILGVATAVPPYPLDQNDVVERVKLLFGRAENLDRLLPVFTNAGIRTRDSCVPIEWYDREHGWAERNRIYLASALDLLEATTWQLLDRTGRDKSDIDGIVVVSTTGIATPSLDALLIERMGLRRTLRRRCHRSRARREPGSGSPSGDDPVPHRRAVRARLPAGRLVEKQHRRDRA